MVPQSTPEPASLVSGLIGVGLLGLYAGYRRQSLSDGGVKKFLDAGGLAPHNANVPRFGSR